MVEVKKEGFVKCLSRFVVVPKVELKKEKDLLKPPSFSCPKERSKHTLDAAVDKIFGGDKWWKKVFSNKKLKQAIKSCVVAPEKDCDGTAEYRWDR